MYLVVFSMIFPIVLMGCITGPSVPKNTIIPPPSYAEAQDLYKGAELISQKLIDSAKLSAKFQQISKIAVADFIGPGDEITGLGEHISDKVSVQLFSSGEFPDFLERRRLKQILQAHKNELSGYFDQETVKKFGKLIGLDSMVIGTVKDLGSYFDVTAEIAESESGRVLGMADIRLIKDPTAEELANTKRTATLTVSVDPPINGNVVAAGRQGYLKDGVYTFVGIPYGECSVLIHPDGYEPIRKSIPIRSHFEIYSVKLKRKKYNVSFQIVPPDASLWVNGKKIPLNTQGFAKILDLYATEYSYVARAKGHQDEVGTFNLVQNAPLIIKLKTDDPFYSVKNKYFTKYQKINEKQSFKVQLWTDKSAYRVGDPIYFSFRTERDCYLSLVNINSRGDITQLFPNRFHSNNFVHAGIRYRIPENHYGFEFTVEPPAGKERIYAFASEKPFYIFEHDFSSQAFAGIARDKTQTIKVKEVGLKLDQVLLNAAAECVIFTKD